MLKTIFPVGAPLGNKEH